MTATGRRVAALALVAVGCGGSETQPATVPACTAPEVALPDNRCIRPGILPEGCAAGFVHDGEYGCEPVLPPAPCPAGLMAVPGESECRPVMACGQGRWGDIPVDAATVHVDGSYTGLDSDGSVDKPFTTIGAAVTSAPRGSLVAIAAGTYRENVVLAGKPLRLWGVCPERVAIVASAVGVSCPAAALCIASGADGAEIHGVALTGAGIGIAVSGSQALWIERVWVHDNALFGLDAESALGPTALSVMGSLFEDNHEVGLFVMGAEATVEATVVRETWPRASDQESGRGVSFQVECALGPNGSVACDPSAPARATVHGALVEQNHEGGLVVAGSEATVEATVVRGTLPRASDQGGGNGVMIQHPCLPGPGGEPSCDPASPSRVTLRGSLVAENHLVGVRISGSQAILESTVVRNQLTERGILIEPPCVALTDGSVQCDSTQPAQATVSRSLVDENQYIGILVAGSEATVQDTVVRGTLPRASDQQCGRGMGVQLACSMLADTTLTCDRSVPAKATVRGSLITQNHSEGIHVLASAATIEETVISATATRLDGEFGDGMAVFSDLGLAQVKLTMTRIETSARAGVSSFGGVVALEAVALQCAAVDLDGEHFGMLDFRFVDGGGVVCGCPSADGECRAVSTGLKPPEPLVPTR